MVATVLAKVRGDYLDLKFVSGRKFAFRPPRTIVIPFASLETIEDARDVQLLFHEIGHAIMGHRDFKTEVGRLKMEVEAWEKARELAERYGVEFDEELALTELDSYREWLHQKSRCPRCGLTRFQTPDSLWHCPRCDIIS